MLTVNYIREINAFMDFVLDEELSGNAQLLWHALMHMANSQGEGDQWPESIRISNRKLLLFLPYSEDTLAAARAELIDAGLLVYSAGSRKERPEYAIQYFSTEKAKLSTSPESKPAINPQINPEISGQSAEQSQTLNAYVHESGDEDEGFRARASGLDADPDEPETTEAIREAWREYIGPDVLRAEAERFLVRIASQLRMPPAVIREAIHSAALANARAPVAYAASTLTDWAEEGVRDLSDLGELQVMRDIYRGKLSGCGTVSLEQLQMAKALRRARPGA